MNHLVHYSIVSEATSFDPNRHIAIDAQVDMTNQGTIVEGLRAKTNLKHGIFCFLCTNDDNSQRWVQYDASKARDPAPHSNSALNTPAPIVMIVAGMLLEVN